MEEQTKRTLIRCIAWLVGICIVATALVLGTYINARVPYQVLMTPADPPETYTAPQYPTNPPIQGDMQGNNGNSVIL
jgi:hypothetical protein